MKNLCHGFEKSADLLSKRQNHEKIFQIMCVSQKGRTLQMNNLKFRFYHRFRFTTVHMIFNKDLGFKKADESNP